MAHMQNSSNLGERTHYSQLDSHTQTNILTPMSQTTTVIIIQGWNSGKYLPKCLDSLSKQSVQDFKVVFVDAGSEDGSIQYVQQNYPNVDILDLQENLGFAKSNNMGMAYAYKKYRPIRYILLNPDTRVDRLWYEKLIKFADHHEGKIISPTVEFYYSFLPITIKPYKKTTLTKLVINDLQYKSILLGPDGNGRAVARYPLTVTQEITIAVPYPARTDGLTVAWESDQDVEVNIKGTHIRQGTSYKFAKFAQYSMKFTQTQGLRLNKKFLYVEDINFLRRNSHPPTAPDGVSGVCMLIPANLPKKYGGFTEAYFNYMEDFELSYRMKKEAGVSFAVSPDSKVYHWYWGSSENVNHFKQFHGVKNKLLFAKEYFPRKYPYLVVRALARAFLLLTQGKPAGSWTYLRAIVRSLTLSRASLVASRPLIPDPES